MKPNNGNTNRPLSAKLMYVARDVSNLPDAIFALNQWTVKSASRGEVEKYLLEMTADGADSGPLRTVLQRVLLQSNNPKQDQTIIAGCARLIASVLLGPACNINATKSNSNQSRKVAHSATMKKAVGELLRRGRACTVQLSGQTQPTPEEFAQTVSNSILDLLQRAAAEKQNHEKQGNECTLIPGSSGCSANLSITFSSESQAQILVQQTENDIAVLSAKLANRQKMPQAVYPSSRLKSKNAAATNSVVVDLMSLRDRAKQIADKSGTVVEISVDCKKRFANNEPAEEGDRTPVEAAGDDENTDQQKDIAGKFQSDEDKNALISKCLGATLQSSVAISVSEATALETKIEGLLNQTSAVKEELTSRQSTIASKRQEISTRMEQIRRELEELARQDVQLATEEKEVGVELERLVRKSDKEIGGLKSKVEAKASHVTLDKELRRAVDKLGELEMAWIRSSSALHADGKPTLAEKDVSVPESFTKQPDQPLATLLPTKLANYLHRARSYFQSEAAIVEFLRNRVSSAEAEVLDLEREVQVFYNLGMKNNVESMSHRLTTLKSHIDEDNVVIDALRTDAKLMREDLIRRVEEYYAAMKSVVGEDTGADSINPEILTGTQVAALEEISISLTGIGFYDDADGGLAAIFSKLPKRVSRVACPANTPSEIECDGSTSYIGDIDMLPEPTFNAATAAYKAADLALPAKVAMPKFSWASKSNAPPKTEKKSLLEIQMEEMAAAKEKNGST